MPTLPSIQSYYDYSTFQDSGVSLHIPAEHFSTRLLLFFKKANQSSPPNRPEGRDSFEAHLPAGREHAERGCSFWRIGERPILQKPHGLMIELDETLWTFDLSRELPGTNHWD
jgi:hypothetical protein